MRGVHLEDLFMRSPTGGFQGSVLPSVGEYRSDTEGHERQVVGRGSWTRMDPEGSRNRGDVDA
jgi:hypothetical protein